MTPKRTPKKRDQEIGDETPGEVVKRRAGGRPTKYNKRAVEKLLKAVREGLTYERASEFAGINKDTLYEWKERHPEFSDALKKADEEGERILLDRIKTAGEDPKFWQANAWILERRFPDRWGRKERVEHTGKDGERLVIKVVTVDGNGTSQD